MNAPTGELIDRILRDLQAAPFSALSLTAFEAQYVTPLHHPDTERHWPEDARLTYEDYLELVEDVRDWFEGSARPGWQQRIRSIAPKRRIPWLRRRADHLRFLANSHPELIIEPNFSLRVVEPLTAAILDLKLEVGMPFDEFRDAVIKARQHLLNEAIRL